MCSILIANSTQFVHQSQQHPLRLLQVIAASLGRIAFRLLQRHLNCIYFNHSLPASLRQQCEMLLMTSSACLRFPLSHKQCRRLVFTPCQPRWSRDSVSRTCFGCYVVHLFRCLHIAPYSPHFLSGCSYILSLLHSIAQLAVLLLHLSPFWEIIVATCSCLRLWPASNTICLDTCMMPYCSIIIKPLLV
jgi:hypothetical protein